MYSLVVLGQIPGTNIRISFTAWLFVGMLAVTAFAYIKVHRRSTTSLSLDPTIAAE
ncbi:MAG TPA: hypothetical protein VGE30_02335 [Candidatus Saccharimonadales bacterium]